MTIGLLTIRLALTSRTLKEKRTIVKSVVERLRTRFNASVAEVDDLKSPTTATIAAVVISTEARHADAQLQSIAEAIEEWRIDAQVISVETELL